jgi:hypothetical protein
MSGFPTIFYTAVAGGDRVAIDAVARDSGARLVLVTRSALPGQIGSAALAGGVIVIVANDVEASMALRAGADEVLRAGEIGTDTLFAAIERAALRFSARNDARVPGSSGGGDLLASVITSELNAPLAAAVVDCDVLFNALGRVLYANERLADWGTLSAPLEQLRELVALRASAPSSTELQARVDNLRHSLARAGSLLRVLRELTSEANDGRGVAVGDVARAVSELLRAHVERVVGGVPLSVVGSCRAHVSRTALVRLVTGVVASAVESVGRTGRGGLSIRVFEAEGAVVLEVEHATDQVGTGVSKMAALADVARSVGGDLLVDEDESCTILRILLPIAMEYDAITAPEPARPRPNKLLS